MKSDSHPAAQQVMDVKVCMDEKWFYLLSKLWMLKDAGYVR